MRLLEIAGNRWRDQMVADLRKVMKLNRHNSLLKSGRVQESLREHRAIMEALAQARRQGHGQEDAGAFPQRAGSGGLTPCDRPARGCACEYKSSKRLSALTVQRALA